MRYSIKPKYRKHVEGYSYLSFAKKFGDKYDMQENLERNMVKN